ncbi:hypothetical protein ACLB2K_039494 [Fragaria x ananassa]
MERTTGELNVSLWDSNCRVRIGLSRSPSGLASNFPIVALLALTVSIDRQVIQKSKLGNISSSGDAGALIRLVKKSGRAPFSFLIREVLGADSVTQLRPIAMANFVFKLVTKMIADKLGSIAARIISPNQSAFLKGRTIVDPIIMTSECINLLDRECKAGNITIKFDVRKAFYTLDWGFLLRVLEAFGFSNLFQDFIKAILGFAHLSILINGATEGFFTCSRGVRQGDPLSSILFCLAEEVLSRGISKLVEEGHIDLLSAPLGITSPSHVLFADDIMVFMRGTKHSLKTVMHFMEEYGLNSGQQVNKAKSLVFLGKYAYR